MSVLKFLFNLFIIYILYKLIFDFVIPVYKAAKQVRKRMSRMGQETYKNKQHEYTHTFDHVRPSAAVHSEDYIDFEEVK